MFRVIIAIVLFSNICFSGFSYQIRHVDLKDVESLMQTYILVAKASSNIMLEPEEITSEYVTTLVEKVIKDGLGFVALDEDKIIGWILKERYPYRSCRHVFYNGNIMVHPDYQGKGIGSALIKRFLYEVETYYPDILRVELFVLTTSPAYALYKCLGFIQEGILKDGKIFPDGSLGSYYFMVWFNPNFDFSTIVSKKN